MRVGVYGLGRFGWMWSKLLAREHEVLACSRNPARTSPPGVALVAPEEITSVDVLVLCVAISAMEEVCAKIAPRCAAGMLVMDTCSVKVAPAQTMLDLLPEGVEILATHPMFGPDSASRGLEGLPMVLCPVRVSERRVLEWEEFFGSMGLEVLRMSAEEHDIEAAYTQGVTHFVGRILADMDLKASRMATVGYRSLLQIIEQTCNDSWQLFVDLQHHNPYTSQMRERLRRSIDRMLQELD